MIVDLFLKPPVIQVGTSADPTFIYVKRNYREEIEKIIEYYKSSTYYVRNEHLLCRILTTGLPPIDYDDYRYLDAVQTRAPFIANHFKLTSEINYGDFKQNVFFSDGVREVIIHAANDYFIEDVQSKWQDISAVKILLHPSSDFCTALLDGSNTSTADGIAVVQIDIALLLIQYRCFLKNQYIDQNTQERLGAGHFIARYVLPAMLRSHSEWVLQNRMMNLFYNAPMSQAIKAAPIVFSKYEDKLDKTLRFTIRALKNKNIQYESMLYYIGSFFEDSARLSMMVPSLAPTRQVWWALVYSRLNYILFLMELGGKSAVKANKDKLSKIRIDIKRLRSDDVFRSILPQDLFYDTDMMLEKILSFS